jgi:glycosyltransferase involved in cell wall biosynthesis
VIRSIAVSSGGKYDPAGAGVPVIRFSVVITCYNQRSFIQAAVDSALAQNSRLAKEIIVVDDGSTDGSRQVLEGYRDSVQLLPLPSNRGPIEARNHGATRAQGEYLVFLDGDDVFMPWALEVYERIIADRKPAVILAMTRWFEGPIPTLKAEDVPDKIQFVEYKALLRKDRSAGLSASAYIVDRQAFWSVGGWSEGIFQLDLQDLSAKLGLMPMVLICSPDTAFYRVHEGNSIHNVPPFVTNLYRLLGKEKAGEYPGGQEHRQDRRAWFGGLIAFWVKRAARAGLYMDAAKLMLTGWAMVLAAVVRRATAVIRGRRPIETMDLH